MKQEPYIKNNYHTHTWRCQHATGTEREYIEAAIDMGIQTLGFSDHTPCPFRNGYVSGMRMTMNQAEEYATTIHQLASEYKKDIRLYLGFECEYFPQYYEEQMKLFQDIGCDYLILGQHFLRRDGGDGGIGTGARTTDDNILKEYVDTVITAMKTGSYLFLCHPDLINYRGSTRVYNFQMTRLCREMKKLHIPLEINCLGMTNRRSYPSDRFFSIAQKVGNEVIIALDAHAVEQMKNPEGYQMCLDLANKYQLNLLEDMDGKITDMDL